FQGSRIARGFGAGKVLASRDKLSAFRSRRVIIKTRIVKMRGTSHSRAQYVMELTPIGLLMAPHLKGGRQES
ncbi:MAG: hypothetical protein L3K05_03480, partial [Thermoplasmata archaeon]|nr:hypothetical protein [Thermoplasmata archaeon]